MFSAEELHAAFTQLLAATDGEVREVIGGSEWADGAKGKLR